MPKIRTKASTTNDEKQSVVFHDEVRVTVASGNWPRGRDGKFLPIRLDGALYHTGQSRPATAQVVPANAEAVFVTHPVVQTKDGRTGILKVKKSLKDANGYYTWVWAIRPEHQNQGDAQNAIRLEVRENLGEPTQTVFVEQKHRKPAPKVKVVPKPAPKVKVVPKPAPKVKVVPKPAPKVKVVPKPAPKVKVVPKPAPKVKVVPKPAPKVKVVPKPAPKVKVVPKPAPKVKVVPKPAPKVKVVPKPAPKVKVVPKPAPKVKVVPKPVPKVKVVPKPAPKVKVVPKPVPKVKVVPKPAPKVKVVPKPVPKVKVVPKSETVELVTGTPEHSVRCEDNTPENGTIEQIPAKSQKKSKKQRPPRAVKTVETPPNPKLSEVVSAQSIEPQNSTVEKQQTVFTPEKANEEPDSSSALSREVKTEKVSEPKTNPDQKNATLSQPQLANTGSSPLGYAALSLSLAALGALTLAAAGSKKKTK
ncbi:hypothetical protein [Boudabousia tangfeifanii]|uniref:hypothetical protein n=1 Tax=Boudabousia tangfeifanii TaxID=1912795 RepID=UPI0012EE5703|nr:hypothetical protein [Boudabousia tangfeifanii]